MGTFRKLRISAGKTQAETAKILGVSADTIARREARDEKLTLRDMRILADFFGCSQNDFFAEHANPPSAPEEAPGKKRVPKTVKRDRRRVG